MTAKYFFVKVEVGDNSAVYTVNSIYEAERLWGDLLLDWTKGLDRSRQINTFQTCHLWILLFHLGWEEKQLLAMKNKNVRSYALMYSNTFLDKVGSEFYNKTGVKTKIVTDHSFTRGCELGTYGDMVIQLYHQPDIAKELDDFYQKVKRIEDVDLARLSELAKRKVEVKVSVFKNPEMANQVRRSVARHFHGVQ